ncbi:hypothetical protein [Lysinibacillus sp. 54212]|uniref:hypothetical protein n=1 Tax=Lysinibacillus sp. 54212 TaxID=3119829 RepID=UPI002FC588B8
MTLIGLVKTVGIGIIALGLLGCENELIAIEDSNSYEWQKYMNETEYHQLMEGMTYLEVVEIAGGQGEQQEENLFFWKDEILMTQAYQIEFKDSKLVSKKIVEQRGHSTRE